MLTDLFHQINMFIWVSHIMVMGRQEGTSSCRLGRKRKVVYLGRPLPKYVIMISDNH